MTTGHSRSSFRRFLLFRKEDECRVSGTGIEAEGVQFSSGQCVIDWLTETPSVGIYKNLSDVLAVHGHGGKTVVKWVDSADSGDRKEMQ